LLVLLMPFVVIAETFDEMLQGVDGQAHRRFENGVIVELNYVTRTIQVSGYDYQISPAFGENTTDISLYGTSAGSLELLSVGMKVEMEYFELGHARLAMAIKELDPNLEVEF
ncbi:MAG: hypothetical protein HON77_12470, partial [Gammaproteobacteria bacterium]|nr:hypothetical protein [Gammaproteobacteria bacterium]